MSPVSRVEKLAFKMMKNCKGSDLIAVFAALESGMEGVLEQIDDDELRNGLAVRLFHMLLSLPVFQEATNAGQAQDAHAISRIENEDRRVTAILDQVKRLVSLSPP